MALAWKAGWVNALRGSNPLSSALKAGRGIPIRCAPPFACTLLGGGVSERPKEHASKACVGVTSPWVQIPPPPPRGPDETRGLGLTKPPERVLRGAHAGGFAVYGARVWGFRRLRGSRGLDRCVGRPGCRSLSSSVSLTGTTERPPAGGRGLSWVVPGFSLCGGVTPRRVGRARGRGCRRRRVPRSRDRRGRLRRGRGRGRRYARPTCAAAGYSSRPRRRRA